MPAHDVEEGRDAAAAAMARAQQGHHVHVGRAPVGQDLHQVAGRKVVGKIPFRPHDHAQSRKRPAAHDRAVIRRHERFDPDRFGAAVGPGKSPQRDVLVIFPQRQASALLQIDGCLDDGMIPKIGRRRADDAAIGGERGDQPGRPVQRPDMNDDIPTVR